MVHQLHSAIFRQLAMSNYVIFCLCNNPLGNNITFTVSLFLQFKVLYIILLQCLWK